MLVPDPSPRLRPIILYVIPAGLLLWAGVIVTALCLL